jgi:hypothetical protein
MVSMQRFAHSALVLASLAGSAFAQTQVGLIGGRLTLTTNNTEQNVKVEMKEGPGVARVFGFQGIPDGTAYTGVSAVTVNTGSARDQVQFDIESRQSMDIRINTGAGDLESKVQWKLLSTTGNTSASVVYTGTPSALQKIEADFDNETANATINLDTGVAGEVTAKLLSDDPANNLGVTFNSRGAKTGFELASNALNLDVTLRGTHSTSFSEVKHVISQLRPANVRVQNDVTLSGGDDKLESKISAPGSNTTVLGAIRGLGGNDNIFVEAEGVQVVNGLTLDGGAGNDFLTNATKGWFQLSQTVGANIFAGPGDDFLILTTDTGIRGTGLPNDVQNIIDGGDGFDLYNAFGFIRNCEGRL